MTTLGKSITGGIIILILVGVGAYYYVGQSTTKASLTSDELNPVVPTEQIVNNTKEPAGKKMAFSQFIKQGGAYTCTVNQTINNEVSKGIMYFDGTRVRSEVTVNMQGQTMTMNFLVLDDYTYTWNSMMPTMGFKMKNNPEASATPTATPNAPVAWNADQIGDYSCDKWTIDESKFVVPSTVKFSAMGS